MNRWETDAQAIVKLGRSQEPWVRLAAARMAGPAKAIPELMAETAAHPLILPILEECSSWPHYTLQRHNDARHAFQKIGFLIDIGLDRSIPKIELFCEKVLARQSDDGAFLCETLIPKSFKGSGIAEWMWISCDFPLLLHAFLALGFGDDPRVKKGTDLLMELANPNGWRCRSSHPTFRGPGKKEDPCPIVNVMALKALSWIENTAARDTCRLGAEMLLNMWETRTRNRFYLFAMGTDFQKLKYPLFWFDILNTTDALSRFPPVHTDPRFLEMIRLIQNKADSQGMFQPESVWMAFKGFDFAQKRESSPMLTLAVRRILSRLEK